jgi:hypothetical protein
MYHLEACMKVHGAVQFGCKEPIFSSFYSSIKKIQMQFHSHLISSIQWICHSVSVIDLRNSTLFAGSVSKSWKLQRTARKVFWQPVTSCSHYDNQTWRCSMLHAAAFLAVFSAKTTINHDNI